MPKLGHKFTSEQKERMRIGHLGQKPWNVGTGGCKKGHNPSLYVPLPSGVYYCMGCKHENAAKYRAKNRANINLKNRVRRYKITVEEYDRISESQNGCCAICGTELNGRNVRIDHNHKTGEIRGLLCTSCNSGIGLLKDSSDVMMRAARYLERE